MIKVLVRVNGKTFFSFFVYVPKVAEPTPVTMQILIAYVVKRLPVGIRL